MNIKMINSAKILMYNFKSFQNFSLISFLVTHTILTSKFLLREDGVWINFFIQYDTVLLF